MKPIQLFVACFLIGILNHASATPAATGFVVRMNTVLGNIDVWLRYDKAPLTVGNFLNYTVAPLYGNTFFHVSTRAPNIIQAGGFYWDDVQSKILSVPTLFGAMNEYSISNVRGTIAMARAGDVNSAKSQWYFNVGDNHATLDPQLVTAFGTVLNDGMKVVDTIAALPVEDQSALNAVFSTLPLIDHTPDSPVAKKNLALISKISLLSSNPPVLGASGNYTSLSFVPLPSVPIADTFASAANPAPDTAPAGVTFGEGFFKIAISGLSKGQTLNMILNLPPGAHPNTYYKWGPTADNQTAHWYNFMWDGKTGAIIGSDPTQVALIFVDGERGDDDYTANGTISDVGAPGNAPAAGGGGGALDWLSLSAGLVMCLRRISARRRQ